MEDDLESELAYVSLLGCMIGVISTLDLRAIASSLDNDVSQLSWDFYWRSLDAHCRMGIYEGMEEV